MLWLAGTTQSTGLTPPPPLLAFPLSTGHDYARVPTQALDEDPDVLTKIGSRNPRNQVRKLPDITLV